MKNTKTKTMKAMVILMNSYYGKMHNLSFTEVWDKSETFVNDFKECPLYNGISDEKLNILFYLLYSNYGNSNIAFNDANLFKFKVYSIIFAKGMKWAKNLDLQDKLDKLEDNEILRGTMAIYNNSLNPSEGGMVTTEVGEIANYINQQNVTKYAKNYIDAYMLYSQSLKDVSTSFIKEFEKLFLKIVRPDYNNLYIN